MSALNAHEIPTAFSVVEAFNSELVRNALARLQSDLQSLPLPMSETALREAHARLLAQAQAALREESFGATEPRELVEGSAAALKATSDANFVASQTSCDRLWVLCERQLTVGKGAWLPSTSRFSSLVQQCNTTLAGCVGPAASRFHNVLLPEVRTYSLPYLSDLPSDSLSDSLTGRASIE
mgnify:CR=1 FL=1